MAAFSRDLGIDLGTMYTVIVEGGEVLFREPTVAAVDVEASRMVAWGQEALDMLGRVPETIEITRPMQNGVIADYVVAETLLSYLIRKVSGPLRLFPPRVMISVPYGVTSVESRAVVEAVLRAGVRDAHLIQQPLAAALGCELPVGTPSGNMIVCMGGGATQAALISMYGIVAAETMREGGLQLDEAIQTYVRRKYGLVIAQPTAEQVKREIGAAVPLDEELSMEIQGQDQVSGLPRPLTLTTGEVVEALEEPLGRVVETVRKVLEKSPPELLSDIIDRGIALCGGGALLRGVDKLLTKELGVPVYRVDNPTTAVAEGAARGLDILPVIRRYLPQI